MIKNGVLFWSTKKRPLSDSFKGNAGVPPALLVELALLDDADDELDEDAELLELLDAEELVELTELDVCDDEDELKDIDELDVDELAVELDDDDEVEADEVDDASEDDCDDDDDAMLLDELALDVVATVVFGNASLSPPPPQPDRTQQVSASRIEYPGDVIIYSGPWCTPRFISIRIRLLRTAESHHIV